MRFLVINEPYARHRSEPQTQDIVEAPSFAGLCTRLTNWEFAGGGEDQEGTDEEVLQRFKQINGDGCDFYVIRELKEDFTLGPDLMRSTS